MAERLGELLRLFVRLGVTAFGGPAAHIAMMHREVVDQRGWLTNEEFVDLIGATNLIPGPNSTEMTMHVGHHRAGWRGLLVAGASFILPAALIVGGLAAVYVEYGSTPSGEALLYGIKPVVVAIVAIALVKLGTATLRRPLLVAVAVVATVLYLAGVHELLVLFGGAAVASAVTLARRPGGLSMVLAPAALSGLVDSEFGLGRLLAAFLKVGALLYGSGYVLLAFLRADLVVRAGVLTDQQLLDAIAVGQFTPGPVFTTATFIGYVLSGVPGAVVATVGIFAPGFLFVALLRRILPHLRDREWTSVLLDGVNGSALGLMAGVLIELTGDAVRDPLTAGLAALALGVLLRTGLNSAWAVLVGGAVGLLAGAAGLV